MTVTLAKQPARTTVPSSGRRVVPHVFTSTALESWTRRVKIHLKSLARVHAPLGKCVDAKLTLTIVPAGRTGRAAGVRRVRVKFAVSAA